MFADLLAEPGVTEEVHLGSTFGFMAFHGGSLEKMTDVVARTAAERAGASLYTVCQPDDLNWHIPSKVVDPAVSPAFTGFLDHVGATVAVHGFGRPGLYTTLLVGGRNRGLAASVGDHLADRLPDYDILTDLDAIPAQLRGQHPDNPVNHRAAPGVQLELPPRVRGLGPYWDERDHDGLSPHTEALVDGLVALARSWMPTRTVSAPEAR